MPLERDIIAAKAVCFAIAMTEPYRDYQRAVKANAAALAAALVGTAACNAVYPAP